MKAYIIIADNEIDQICETVEDTLREQIDLIKMGCEVLIVTCPFDYQDAKCEEIYEYIDQEKDLYELSDINFT